MIAHLNLVYVALLLWGVPAYLTWLWWMHQIDQALDAQAKWGLVVLTALVGVGWFISWPLVWPRKKKTLRIELIEADTPSPGSE